MDDYDLMGRGGGSCRLLFGRIASETQRTRAWSVNALGICCPECSAAQTREGKLCVGLFNHILSCRPQNVDTTMWKTVPAT